MHDSRMKLSPGTAAMLQDSWSSRPPCQLAPWMCLVHMCQALCGAALGLAQVCQPFSPCVSLHPGKEDSGSCKELDQQLTV